MPGYGTLVDTQNAQANAPAELEPGISDANTYSFVLVTPELATLILLLTADGMLPFLRRKF